MEVIVFVAVLGLAVVGRVYFSLKYAQYLDELPQEQRDKIIKAANRAMY